MKRKTEQRLQAELDALTAKCESQKQDLLLLALARRDKRQAIAKEISQRAKNMKAEGLTSEQIADEIQRICAAKPDDGGDVRAKIKADLIEAGRKYGLSAKDFE